MMVVAPARILPFTAKAALSGGHACEMHTDGKVRHDEGAASKKVIGFALTDAVADGPCSIVTGKGVVLNARSNRNCSKRSNFRSRCWCCCKKRSPKSRSNCWSSFRNCFGIWVWNWNQISQGIDYIR